jgi:hypothetical protein
MAEITDKKVKSWLSQFKKKIKSKYSPEKIIMFGSRARKDNFVDSDIDLIIVSRKFGSLKWPRRISSVASMWPGLIDIEPLCYTPEEFEKKKKQLGIVQQAVKEGVEV